MSHQEVLQVLQLGRSHGARGLWLGGGEPTLYSSLADVIVKARAMGYRSVRLQTNALRLAHREFAEHLVSRGVTHVAVSLVGADANSHDRYIRVDGGFELVLRALENLSNLGVELDADVLVTSSNLHSLAEVVRTFSHRGIRRFWFWLVSLHGVETRQLESLVPTLPDAAKKIAMACDTAESFGLDAWSLHTPPCTLPARHRHRYRHAGTWKLLVATPGRRRFMAEHSPMEGGAFLAECATCAARRDCLGLRADYLAVHGAAGIVPVPT